MITPQGGAGVYYQGREVLSDTAEGLSFWLVPSSVQHDGITFECAVTNIGTGPETIFPTNFSLAALETRHSDRGSYASEFGPKFCKPYDPEWLIDQNQRNIAREQKQMRGDATAEAVTGLLGLAVAVAEIGDKKTPQAEKDRRQADRQQSYSNYRSLQAAHTSRVAAYQQDIDFYKSTALRTTTLQPGQQASGLLFFSRVDHMSRFLISYRIHDRTVAFEYKQEMR